MRSPYWYAGFAVGLLVTVGLALVVRILLRRPKEYDERQRIAQGQAYMVAFWSLMVFLALVALVQILFETEWFNVFTLSIVSIVLAVAVYCIACILKDAYLPLRETPARFYLTGLLVIVCNLAAMAGNLGNTPLLLEGQLTTTSMNLLIAVMYLVILLVYAGKQWHDRREETE